jgi:ribosomal protein S6
MSDKDKDLQVESNQVYELGFHLVPTLGDDTVGKAFDTVIKLIEKVGGKVVSKSDPALLNLEYTMEKTVDSEKSKYNTAYFSWVIFEGGNVQELHEALESDREVLRFLLIKTEQKDSISSAEVASIINGDETEEEKPETEKEEENKDDNESNLEEKEDSEEEKEKDQKTNDDKVDEAIDELVK